MGVRFSPETQSMKWFVYIVKCLDDSLYTGITTHVKRRVNEHNHKVGAKSLRGKVPVSLVYCEQYDSRVEAAKRESEIKGWNREKKIFLIKGFTLNNRVKKGLP